MYIIGLHNDEDSGVSLMKDGVILEAISEERLKRIKLYKGFPELSLKYVLDKHNLELGDIDYFAYGWHSKKKDCYLYANKLAKRIIHALNRNHTCSDIIRGRLEVECLRDKNTLSDFELKMESLDISDNRIIYLDHHKTHAWSAFAPSPFDEAIVFTFDGRGDLKSGGTFFANKSDGIQEYDYLLTFDSLGYLYGKITKYLGFTPHRHEGKVTGLAAYGDYTKTLPIYKKLINWENGTIVSNLGFYTPFFSVNNELAVELDKFSKEDVAAGVQKHCEDLIVNYITHWIKKINKPEAKNVCLSGGLFANVKINQKVREIEGIENVYVFPHMGDGGLPVGSVCYLNYLLTGQSKIELPTVYHGPAYSNDEILKVLENYSGKIRYKRIGNKIRRIVDDLISENVVGYFDNRMEYGPRALGARSILYHAREKKVNEWLNKRLRRTEFMPFAPVTPAEYAGECYINWNENHVCSYFMTITYDCTESFKKVHEAVVHVDGTARPQIISEDLNGDYYKVVKMYCDVTGERALINTSFNQHEEPIVCSPEDAIESLLKDNVDILFIGDYKVAKK